MEVSRNKAEEIRVAIGSKSLLSPLTGIGQYAVQLTRELNIYNEITLSYCYGLFWNEARTIPVGPSGAEGGQGQPRIPHRLASAVRRPAKWLVPWHYEAARCVEQFVFTRGADRRAIDVYHEPNFIPYRFDGPTVINIHDLTLLSYPETQPAQRVKAVGKLLPWAAEAADTIITGSEYVRREILETFPVSPEKVVTIANGVDSSFRPSSLEQAQPVLARYGLEYGQYVLAVGTLEPRKNLVRLLRAFARLPAALRERFPLVIVGMKGWHYGGLARELDRLVDAGQVRLPGYVSAADLPSLYAGATVMAYPSLYEGFGFPPLEAMASGVPVLASNRSSIPEVVGDAGVLVEPEDDESIAWPLQELLEDEDRRREMVDRGLERARGFTWERTARMTLEVYRQVLGKN